MQGTSVGSASCICRPRRNLRRPSKLLAYVKDGKGLSCPSWQLEGHPRLASSLVGIKHSDKGKFNIETQGGKTHVPSSTNTALELFSKVARRESPLSAQPPLMKLPASSACHFGVASESRQIQFYLGNRAVSLEFSRKDASCLTRLTWPGDRLP